ncbi:MAG: aminotransferase class I/II-fold pyridoxal phosphate-dependent enzyme [Suilimivivens sp.]
MKRELFEELKRYGESDFYPFHMPGHKRNPDSGPFSDIYQYDITEIDGFDNLHQAEGIIKEAQERAAELYHSKQTYFLVNGSTSGILAAISAVAERGRKLIMARNCHKSVYHGVFLNHLEPEYIYPEMIEEFGISDGIKAWQVEEKIKEVVSEEEIALTEAGSLIAGIVITSPTYEGILSDITGIVRIAHSYGIPVIVDQAHGAHFGFHPAFPESAVTEGADLVIHSVHKTLPSPTQTALLHDNSSIVNGEIVKKYLKIYQSSSPSYILMAGIDACMEIVKKEGRKRQEQLLFYRSELTEEAKELKYIRIYPSMIEMKRDGKTVSKAFAPGTQEPGRLLISVRGTGFTGQQLYDVLRVNYHLQMEMCGSDYVIAILSMMDRKEGFVRLSKALKETDRALEQKLSGRKQSRQNQKEAEDKVSLAYQQYRPKIVLKPGDAYRTKGRYIPLEEAEEKITADFVNLYPPGIPVLVPGEKIDHGILQMIKEYLNEGYTVQGIERNKADERYYLKVII